MKCLILFSGKNTKNAISLSSAEYVHRVVKVAQNKAIFSVISAGGMLRIKHFFSYTCWEKTHIIQSGQDFHRNVWECSHSYARTYGRMYARTHPHNRHNHNILRLYSFLTVKCTDQTARVKISITAISISLK